MREIEFRAWAGGIMVYFDLFNIKATENGLMRVIAPQYHVDRNNPTIMQYTGLKDKNGKKIFEGDILEATFNNARSGIRGSVEYVNGMFVVDFRKGGGNQCYSLRDRMGWGKDYLDQDEVIGNIYETPELLKANTIQTETKL